VDPKFQAMLVEAEEIRAQCVRTGDIGPHAAQMTKMINYGQNHNLLTGNIFDGSASDEFLSHATEMAACCLEVIYKEKIGPVLNLSDSEKIEINRLAVAKARAKMSFFERFGRLP